MRGERAVLNKIENVTDRIYGKLLNVRSCGNDVTIVQVLNHGKSFRYLKLIKSDFFFLKQKKVVTQFVDNSVNHSV